MTTKMMFSHPTLRESRQLWQATTQILLKQAVDLRSTASDHITYLPTTTREHLPYVANTYALPVIEQRLGAYAPGSYWLRLTILISRSAP